MITIKCDLININQTKYDEIITYEFAIDDSNKLETIKEYTKGIEPTYIGIERIEKVVQ